MTPPTAEELATVARRAYGTMVLALSDAAKWAPIVALFDAAGGLDGVVQTGGGGTRDLLAGLAEVVTPSTWAVGLTFDSYVCDDEGINQRVADGETTLGELYRRGHPGVVDALCTVLVFADRPAEHHLVWSPYRRHGPLIEWLPGGASDPGTEMTGRIHDGLLAILGQAHN